MTQQLKFAFLMLLAAGAAWFAPAAKADEWDKRTVLTFKEPVEIPGKVLPAGTYVFKLADSQSDRNIVQIFTEDQKTLLATIMAIPTYRVEPTGDTLVTFEERPSGSPVALHKWFYPGDNYGFEFVYPKSETQLAVNSGQPAHAPAPPPAPPQEPIAEQPKVEPAAPVVREQEVVIAEPTDNATPPQSQAAPPSVPNTLPQTAGNFASILLLGITLLSGGFTALRFAAKPS